MFFKRLTAFGLTLSLAACGGGIGVQSKAKSNDLPRYYAVAGDPLPPEVSDNVPEGVAREDIIARTRPEDLGPCYFYRKDGGLLPLTTPELVAAGFTNQPYCIQ